MSTDPIKNGIHTVLGSGGAIGSELRSILPAYAGQIRWVKRTQGGSDTVSADLTDAAQTMKAVEGSAVVYLLAGLRYSTDVWRVQWPAIMRNVIEACKRHKARCVFFDNLYCYGIVDGWMTEETPMRPVSRKGEIRAGIAQMLLDEMRRGDLQALIARSPDFHGPAKNTVLQALVYPKLIAGKSAVWLCNDRVKHSFILPADAAKAVAMLGGTESAYGQVWHLPTHRDALTGKQYIEECARQLNVPARYKVYSRTFMRLGGIFDPTVRESVEMLYQYEREYLFDSSKFDRTFSYTPATYSDGIRAGLNALRTPNAG